MEGGGISARNLKMSVVLPKESFKPSTDFQVSIDVLIYVILDVHEFLFFNSTDSLSFTSFTILKCLCIPHSTHRSLRTCVLLCLCQICKELQVIEREFCWLFYTERRICIRKNQDEPVKE